MTAKEYLGQAYRIDQRINSKLEQVQSLRGLAAKATLTLGDGTHNATRNVHSMQETIAKIVDLENEINRDIDSLVDVKREIVSVIKRVQNPEYQTLLELRYLCYKTWPEISVKLSLDSRWVHRLHTKSLSEVDVIRHL